LNIVVTNISFIYIKFKVVLRVDLHKKLTSYSCLRFMYSKIH